MAQRTQQRDKSNTGQAVALLQIDELRRLWKNIAPDPPVEQVHKLRTTTRRVEAVFTALRLEKEEPVRRLLRLLKMVRKGAGDVRDLDVFSAIAIHLPENLRGDALTKLAEHIQSKRFRKARLLVRLVEKHRRVARRGLKRQQKRMDDSLRHLSARETMRRDTDMQASVLWTMKRLGSMPNLDATLLHAFRIEIKKVRYRLQLLPGRDGKLLAALGTVKDAIGDWHDYLELMKMARRFQSTQGSDCLLSYLESMEKKKLHHALAIANNFRQNYLEAVARKGQHGQRERRFEARRSTR